MFKIILALLENIVLVEHLLMIFLYEKQGLTDQLL